YPAAQFDGPGFLSGQGYYTQYTVGAIATRLFLMREAVVALAPRFVTVFDGEISPWFRRDGYVRNPWLDVLDQLASQYHCRVDRLSAPRPVVVEDSLLRRSIVFARRARRYARRASLNFWRRRVAARRGFPSVQALRLLMADSLSYDWAPVLDALHLDSGVRCFSMTGVRLDDREWTY